MTEQALIYVFAVPGILALFGVGVWFDAWRRARALDVEIAAYRAKRPTNGRPIEPTVRFATLDPSTRASPPWARSRRARAESMRVSPMRPRQPSSELSPGE